MRAGLVRASPGAELRDGVNPGGLAPLQRPVERALTNVIVCSDGDDAAQCTSGLLICVLRQ